jgi:Mn2+/Fe2+ NRAMP family transporter
MKNQIERIEHRLSKIVFISHLSGVLLALASLVASLAGALGATLASSLTFEGLRKSSTEIGIKAEYVPFAASILSAIVGLALIFILARTFYKKRMRSKALLIKRVRILEKRFFELTERNFDALVGAHGRR